MPKLSNVVVFVATILVCMIALEFGFRLVKGVPVLSTQNWRAQREIITPSIFDAQIGWVQKPNLSADQLRLHTIDYGIRKNRSSMTTVPTGGVLVTGDSFAAGSEVDDTETWPAQLETMIGQPVVNAASGAYGIDQMVLRAENLLPIVRPKIIVVGTQRDGIFRTTYSGYVHPKPYFRIVNGELEQHGVSATNSGAGDHEKTPLKEYLGHSFFIDQMMARLAPKYWEKVWEEKIEQTNESDIELSCLLMRRMKKDADRIGARLIFVLQYGADVIRSANERPKDAVLVAECSKQIGIDVVDEFDTLRAVASRGLAELKSAYIVRPDGQTFGHMSAYGNRLVAELIAATLREKPPQATPEGIAQFEQARRTAQLGVMPDQTGLEIVGDGLNRLAALGSFETLPPSTITKVTLATPGDKPEYELIAQGDKSEHYRPLSLSPSNSGPYTLSIQVKPIHGAKLRLQILDKASNAALADIDLVRSRVTVTRLGRADGQKSTITPIGAGWNDISLSVILPDSGAQVIVQVVAASGEATFLPEGEGIRFRNFRVEGGRFGNKKSAEAR